MNEPVSVTGCSHTTPMRADWSTQPSEGETHYLIEPVEDVADNAVIPETLDDTPTQQAGDQQRNPQRSRKSTQRFGIDD